VCLCAYACVRACVRARVRMCVCEREREREIQRRVKNISQSIQSNDKKFLIVIELQLFVWVPKPHLCASLQRLYVHLYDAGPQTLIFRLFQLNVRWLICSLIRSRSSVSKTSKNACHRKKFLCFPVKVFHQLLHVSLHIYGLTVIMYFRRLHQFLHPLATKIGLQIALVLWYFSWTEQSCWRVTQCNHYAKENVNYAFHNKYCLIPPTLRLLLTPSKSK
jgi:hypothetical protein